MVFRPHFGLGFASISNKQVEHAGLRVLSSTNERQSYGVELTKIQYSGREVNAVGIVLEQTLGLGFKMGIGTIGYMNFENNTNPFGLVTNLGWEPFDTRSWRPFVTYRGDYVFSQKDEQIHSISVGIGVEF